jgi:hypothetical protein
MVSRSDNNSQKNTNKDNQDNKDNKDNKDDQDDQDIKLGGFPSIMYLGQRNKKINEFAKVNDKDANIKNISKLNILDIKNILGVN